SVTPASLAVGGARAGSVRARRIAELAAQRAQQAAIGLGRVAAPDLCLECVLGGEGLRALGGVVRAGAAFAAAGGVERVVSHEATLKLRLGLGPACDRGARRGRRRRPR